MEFCKETSYERTSIGDIPSDWKMVTLEDVTLSHKQGFYTSDSYSGNGIRLVRITDLLNPKVSYETMPFLNVDDRTYEQFRVTKGDFLFARSGAIGRHGIVTENVPCIFASYIIRFRFDESLVNNYFLSHLFQSDFIKKQFLSKMHGATNVNINAENIKSIRIPLPPLPEQRAIVGVLSVIDSALEFADQIIAKTERLKKGLMQQLLRHGMGHAGHKQTAVGPVPADWKVLQIKDIADVKEGIYGRRGTGNIIQLKADSIGENGKINPSAFAKISSDRDVSKYLLEKGDILFNNRNSADLVGKSAVFLGEFDKCVYSNLLTRIRLNSKETTPQWVVYMLTQMLETGRLKALSTRAVNQALLKKEAVEKLSIALPTVREQNEITRILSTADVELEIEKNEKMKLERIKQGMMDLLLTGKVRFKVD